MKQDRNLSHIFCISFDSISRWDDEQEQEKHIVEQCYGVESVVGSSFLFVVLQALFDLHRSHQSGNTSDRANRAAMFSFQKVSTLLLRLVCISLLSRSHLCFG